MSGVDSCTSPDRSTQLAAFDAVTDVELLAEGLLASVVCPRRSSTDRAAYLTARWDECSPSAVVYARQSFCDPGAYDCLTVAELAAERGLPFLEVEVGMPFEANGALRVRLEAFLEAQEFDADLLDADLFDLDPSIHEDDQRQDVARTRRRRDRPAHPGRALIRMALLAERRVAAARSDTAKTLPRVPGAQGQPRGVRTGRRRPLGLVHVPARIADRVRPRPRSSPRWRRPSWRAASSVPASTRP